MSKSNYFLLKKKTINLRIEFIQKRQNIFNILHFIFKIN